MSNEVVSQETAKLLLQYCKFVNKYLSGTVTTAKTKNRKNPYKFVSSEVLEVVSHMNHRLTVLTDYAKSINWQSVSFANASILVSQASLAISASHKVEQVWGYQTALPSYKFVKDATNKMLTVIEVEAYKATKGGE
jgi:hypothetical protein